MRIDDIVRQLLFLLSPETAHHLSLALTKLAATLHLLPTKIITPRTVMGLQFDNPVGLAAGFDKNGDYIDALLALGFGFIEVGTVTPLAQNGNPKPRLFRLHQQYAIVNAMGFNNKGAEYVAAKLKGRRAAGIVGINIGKNANTPLERAHEDYLLCFNTLAPLADYVTINISSPNTENLQSLQSAKLLPDLLDTLKQAQLNLKSRLNLYIPLVVKISPDLMNAEIKKIAEICQQFEIDGIIATNTKRVTTLTHPIAGGLSGPALTTRRLEIQKLIKLADENLTLIASGGIMTDKDAENAFAAGASLIQLYTGFIYHGPRLINKVLK